MVADAVVAVEVVEGEEEVMVMVLAACTVADTAAAAGATNASIAARVASDVAAALAHGASAAGESAIGTGVALHSLIVVRIWW